MEHPQKILHIDGERPVGESELEIAGTFQDGGTRPIEESPDFLLTENSTENSSNRTTRMSTSKVVSTHPIVEVRTINKSEK